MCWRPGSPGPFGQITLELLNVGSRTLKIPVGWRVAHVSFEQLDKDLEPLMKLCEPWQFVK